MKKIWTTQVDKQIFLKIIKNILKFYHHTVEIKISTVCTHHHLMSNNQSVILFVSITNDSQLLSFGHR